MNKRQNQNQNSNQERWALITGGTKGLGLAVADLLAQKGCHLILNYRRDQEGAQRAAQDLISRHSISCHLLAGDLSEEGGMENLMAEVKRKIPFLHYYVHNAAATAFKDLLDLESHHIDKTMNLTVKSFILGMKHLVPLMEAAGGGSVVTVSGMDTLKAVPRHGLLGAAKSALETLTNYYAHELAARGIRVNGVNPGFLETDSTRKYLGPYFETFTQGLAKGIPSKRLPQLEEVARVILFLLQEESSWVVGQTLKVDGGQDFAVPFFNRD